MSPDGAIRMRDEDPFGHPHAIGKALGSANRWAMSIPDFVGAMSRDVPGCQIRGTGHIGAAGAAAGGGVGAGQRVGERPMDGSPLRDFGVGGSVAMIQWPLKCLTVSQVNGARVKMIGVK